MKKIYKLLSNTKQGVFTLTLTGFLGTAYAQTTFTFNYTGGVQTMNLQGGNYKVECWGGNGGDNMAAGTGGKGGYATGTISVAAPGPYYIYVGGKGITGIGGQPSASGGFNGGGTAGAYATASYGMGSGGGATHIASAPGLLSALSGNQSAVAIVAGGGGGGGSNHGAANLQDLGGNGGGLTGGNGLTGNPTYGGTGGTQTAGGTGNMQNGSFGQGGNNSGSNTGGGGGGGWYGGGAAQWEGSGGGSSYIGGVTNGVTMTFTQTGFPLNPDPSGNGYLLLTELCNIGFNPSKNPICIGEAITLTTSAVSNIVWGHTPSTATLVNVSPTSNTTYSLTGKAGSGCTTSAIVIVTVNPLPALSAVVMPSVVCVNGTATLVASGANTYTWTSLSATGPVVTANPPATTSYNYSGTNQFGCVNSALVNVTVNTNQLGISSNTSVCQGSPVQLSLSNAVTYTWSTGNNFATTVVSPLTNTTYMASGTDIYNCVLSNMVAVTVNQKPNVIANTNKGNVCKGESVTLTAGGATTYTWNNGLGTAASVNVTLPAETVYNHAVIGTDANGCTNTANIQVTANRCTGINEATKEGSFLSVYPNPSLGEVTVESNASMLKSIEVIDLSGRTVMTQDAASNTAKVDISTLSEGVYYFKVGSVDSVEILKVVKNK